MSDSLKWQYIRCRFGFQNCFWVPSNGRSGGLAVLWDSKTNLTIMNYSFWHVDFVIQFDVPIRYTLFYGNPNPQHHHVSWDLIRTLAYTVSLPWCIFGDFNEILNFDESSSQNYRRGTAIAEFQRVISDTSLTDLGFLGNKFTYSNRRRGSAEVKVRLDRFFGDAQWCLKFPNAKVKHLVSPVSGHCPIFYVLTLLLSLGIVFSDLGTCGKR